MIYRLSSLSQVNLYITTIDAPTVQNALTIPIENYLPTVFKS